MLAAVESGVPDDVAGIAARQSLDAYICAFGAWESPPVHATMAVCAPTPDGASLWWSPARVSLLDAILVNATAVRHLDANDVFLDPRGSSGHPSDLIPMVMAIAERADWTGRRSMTVVALAYELMWRLRQHLWVGGERARSWDGSSVCSVISAAVTALGLGGRHDDLANAIRLGAAQGHLLSEVRFGEISMLKASASAVTCRAGVLAGQLAVNGMTGPRRVFEGSRGLCAALGVDAGSAVLDAITAPPQWAIRRVSTKAFPAIGTSQAALSAAVRLRSRLVNGPRDVQAVRVKLPARWATRHNQVPERSAPETRESADHSISFLVALALTTGDIRPSHFDNELWRAGPVAELMRRVSIEPCADLEEQGAASFPAIVEVVEADGRVHAAEERAPTGSPDAPMTDDDALTKFERLAEGRLEQAQMRAVIEHFGILADAPSMVGWLRGRPANDGMAR